MKINRMPAFILALLIFGPSSLMASGWNNFDVPPKEGQLYMQIHMDPGFPASERQTMFISHWNGKPIIKWEEENGWWEVNQTMIWKLLNEGNKIVYIPSDLKSLEYLNVVISDFRFHTNKITR